jgi:hypothetical protein
MKIGGYLSLGVLANFPRIKNMTQDLSVVVKGIQASKELELDEDSTSVRPKHEPEQWPLDDENIMELPAPKFAHPPVMMAYAPIIPGFSLPITIPASGNVHVPIMALSPGSEMLNPNVPEFVPLMKVPIENEELAKKKPTLPPPVRDNKQKTDDNDNQSQKDKKTVLVSTAKTNSTGPATDASKLSPTKSNPEVEVSWQEVKKKPKPVSKQGRRRLTSVDDDQTQFAFEEDTDLAPSRTRTYSSNRYSV